MVEIVSFTLKFAMTPTQPINTRTEACEKFGSFSHFPIKPAWQHPGEPLSGTRTLADGSPAGVL